MTSQGTTEEVNADNFTGTENCMRVVCKELLPLLKLMDKGTTKAQRVVHDFFSCAVGNLWSHMREAFLEEALCIQFTVTW